MKVCIDPGHGGRDEGTPGTQTSESNITLLLSLLFGNMLIRNGVTVVYTRKDNTYLDLQDRCTIANKNKCDYFISFHCNNGCDPEETGSDIFCHHFGEISEKLAIHLLKTLTNLNKSKDRKVKEGEFHVLKNTNMPSVLIQVMHLSNPNEERKLLDPVWQRLFAEELAWSFLSFTGFKSEKDFQRDSFKISIMGNSLSTVDEMENYVHQKNPNAPYLSKLYLRIGKEEGLRGDIAFSQALIETNYFSSDDYPPDTYNYINLRSAQSNGKIAEFQNPAEGIQAHIQHLKAYASTEGLNTPLVDPIFHLVPRGSVMCWEDLDDHWFLPKVNYGKQIIQQWKNLLKLYSYPVEGPDDLSAHWKGKGIIPEGIDLEKPVTWKELIQVLNKLNN